MKLNNGAGISRARRREVSFSAVSSTCKLAMRSLARETSSAKKHSRGLSEQQCELEWWTHELRHGKHSIFRMVNSTSSVDLVS